jgi:hypothetical protein
MATADSMADQHRREGEQRREHHAAPHDEEHRQDLPEMLADGIHDRQDRHGEQHQRDAGRGARRRCVVIGKRRADHRRFQPFSRALSGS